MYYFTELTVRSFGLHVDKTVEFTPGVNVIVGESETGKTTLLRALYLLIENSPRGGEKRYQSDYSDEPLFIQLKDSFNNKIVRTKNKYYLNDGKALSAFGTDVPETISNILNFKEINWQKQISEKPFMLFNTGGAAAKDLNKITGLQDQVIILADIKNQISERKTNIKRLFKNNEEHKDTIEKLKNVTHFKMKSAHLINKRKESNEIEKLYIDLEEILGQLEIMRRRKMTSFNIIEKFSLQVGKIVKGKGVVKEYDGYINNLGDIISQLERIPKFDKSTIMDHGTVLQKIVTLNNNSKNIKEKIINLYALIERIQELKKLYKKANKEVIEINKELDNIFNEIGYCPLCNRPIEGDNHEC